MFCPHSLWQNRYFLYLFWPVCQISCTALLGGVFLSEKSHRPPSLGIGINITFSAEFRINYRYINTNYKVWDWVQYYHFIKQNFARVKTKKAQADFSVCALWFSALLRGWERAIKGGKPSRCWSLALASKALADGSSRHGHSTVGMSSLGLDRQTEYPACRTECVLLQRHRFLVG